MDPASRLNRRHVLTLTAILALATLLRVARLEQNGFGTPYYAAAVRSMTMSWHNLMFGAFDPVGFLAIDKPPVAFWLQATSVSLLGFSGLALHLPQVIEGIAAIALLFHLVRRSFGPGTGLLAGLFLAVTPISVAVDRSNNTDSCLVLMQLLAAWPLILAVERASLALLLLSAAILGVAFNVKMSAALLVLPAFIGLYAFNAPVSWGRRIAHLTAAAVVLTGVSLSWPMAVDLTPPEQRPYVDSTVHNSVLELALGHNAVDRFIRPDWLAMAVPPGTGTPRAVPAGPLRLADPLLASQFAWLVPLALFGLWYGRGWRDRCLWGGWALVCGIVFSAAGGIFLPYYLAAVAPPLAALAAIGIRSLRGVFHIAIALIVTAAWQVGIILGDGPDWIVWLIAMPVAAALVGTLPWAVRLGTYRRDNRILRASVVLGCALLLAGPLAWSTAPILARGNPTRPVARLPDTGLNMVRAALAGDGLGNRTRLLRFLATHRGTKRYAMATTSILEASSMIIRTGDPVMTLGGYTGTTVTLTQADLARRVAAGDVRYVLIGGTAAADPTSPLFPLLAWVRSSGREIDPAEWWPPIPHGPEPFTQRRAVYLTGLALFDMSVE